MEEITCILLYIISFLIEIALGKMMEFLGGIFNY